MNGFKTVGQILEGHFNKALDKVGWLPDDTKRLSELRFAYCQWCHVTPTPQSKASSDLQLPSASGVCKQPDVVVGPGLRERKYCKSSGCNMEAYTKVISAKCPIGRW